MRSKSKPKWLLFIVVLVMTALACTCGLPFNLGETQEQQETSQIVQPSTDFGLLEEEQGFVMPEMPGTTIPLETGGSLFVPEGALPQGTAINAYESEDIPLMPEGVQPVGQSLIITADAQPSSPVLLRLPIPPGVDDPTNLVIIRIESDGKSTLLMPEVDGSDLLAYTPGFSKFFMASIPRDFEISLRGPSQLMLGQPATYSIGFRPESTFGAIWKISGDGILFHQSDDAAIIQAGGTLDYISLSVEFIDLHNGLRWYGGRYIQVTQEPGFKVSLITTKPIVYEGDSVHIQADVHGEYTTPITYSWNFDDGGPGGSAVSSPGTTAIDLPPKLFAAQENVYLIIVKAQDATGNESAGLISIRVNRRVQMLKITGETNKTWVSPGVFGGFDASASGQDRSYRFNWMLKPGEQVAESTGLATNNQNAVSKAGFMFTEPGEYLVEVVLYDITEGEAELGKAVLPVHVVGGSPLDAHILSWPEVIKPNDITSFTFRAGGGTRVVGGQNGRYKVSIYWGDGTSNEETIQATDQVGYEPFIFNVVHQWAEPGPYTVMLFVEDPTGSIAYSEADIVVQEPKLESYAGEVFIAIDPQLYLLELVIHESQVDLTVTDEIISANVSFSYSFNLVPGSRDNPEENCVGFYEFAFSGEGPFTDLLSLEMTQTHFIFSKVGPSCNEWSGSDPVGLVSTTLSGTFFEDGSFYGTLDPDQYNFRYYGVSANRVEE